MRRNDREVIDKREIIEIIAKCDVCRLALMDNESPYIVPMNFGYEFINDQLSLFFHSAIAGKKIDLLKNNSLVCFEMDCSHNLIKGDIPCQYTMEYESVIGYGTVKFSTTKEEKINYLRILMNQYSDMKSYKFEESILDKILTFKIEVSSYTGKRLKK